MDQAVAKDRLRRLVVANFFPAFHPSSSGGEQRYYHFYEHLSRRFDVTLVSATYADHQESRVEHSPTFREYRIPKHPESNRLHWQLEMEGIGPECSGYVVALLGALETAYGERLRVLIGDADAVIHESPFTVPYDSGMGSDGIPRIYNSYNVEADLARQMMQGRAGEEAAEFIEDLERHLIAHSELVFATNPEECDTFAQRYGVERSRLHLAPNGFEDETDSAGETDAPRDGRTVVFLGSGHPPNVEALEFIATNVAPANPRLQFEILGGAGKAYAGPVPDNVRLRGFLPAEEKSALLSRCAAAINPLFSGSGTNLKMLDYMAHGAPIVTTKIGARGLEVIDGVHVAIASPEDFAAALGAVVSDPERSRSLGAHSAELAHKRYSWRSIAESVADTLDRFFAARRSAERRPRILSVCDYPVDQASGGGQVRIRQLLTELGKEFDVTLLCLANDPAVAVKRIAPGVSQRAIPKTPAHLAEDRSTSDGEWVSIADLVAARQCLGNPALVEAFKAEIERSELVLFEQCFMAPLLEWVPPSMPVIYSSQNREVELKRELLAQRRDGAALLAEVEAVEHRLVERAEVVVCVSEADAAAFASWNPEAATVVIENGVAIPDAERPERAESGQLGHPLAVFLGSGHPPNARAARFIIAELAPRTPQVIYSIAGSVCDGFHGEELPANVLLLGFLTDDEKASLLRIADMAVNPLFEGGGSSLKVPDFFAAGLPTVSSLIGMRGYPARDGAEYVQADPEHFAEAVLGLCADGELRERIGRNCRHLVERQFDWRILGGKLRRTVRGMLKRDADSKRLLALTYRFGDPPRGGAEVFLSKVLESMAADSDWEITIAATEVGAIHNHLMFSALYEPVQEQSVPSWSERVQFFPADPAPDTLMADCRRLHAVWMAESRVLGRKFADHLPDASLAGGWNYPEAAKEGVSRWASTRAQIKLPPHARRLRIDVYAAANTSVELARDGGAVSRRDASGRTVLEFDLPTGGGLFDLASAPSYQAAGDPRDLGVHVRSISFEGEQGTQAVDLRFELDRLPAAVPLQEWVQALIDVASERDPSDDARFVRVRGPGSSAMRAWLESRIHGFDAVLVQGVPFATSVIGVDAARKAGVPVVVLPHCHIEDRYYHWQAFYDAFRDADRVIAAPDASVVAYFEKIGAKAIALPGGGVTLAEFDQAALDRGRSAFRRAHAAVRPFVLVLGRKADGKNYQDVLDAHARLRAAGHDVDLVMIGPDDDGRPVRGEGVFYLGPQPRDVVIGALAETFCLATMSESESFGIVILEAWLAGAAVVASGRSTAFQELVVDGVNGRLVGDVDALTAAIEGYLTDRDTACRHAARGSEMARGYAWPDTARKIDALLRSATRPADHRELT